MNKPSRRTYHALFLMLCLCAGTFVSKAQNLNIDSCLQVLKTSKEDTGKAILLSNIAWDISYQNLQKGIDYAQQSVDLAEKLQYELRYCRVYHVIGAIYSDMAEQGKALNYFLKAITYGRKYNQQGELAFVYNSLGNFYTRQGEMRKGMSYYLQAVEAHKKVGSKRSIYTPYNNLSASYLKLNKMDSAIYYINLCVAFNEKDQDNNRLTNNYITLSEIYMNGKHKEKSLFYAKKGVEAARGLNDKYTLSRALSQQGNAHFANSKDQESINSFAEAIDLARQTGDITTLQSSAILLSNVYETSGDFKNALAYYKQFKSFRDSTMNRENIEQMRSAEARYENEKKQKEIELMAEKQKRSDAESEKGRLYLYFAGAGILGLGVLLVLAFNNNRAKQKANRELESFNSRISEQKELVEEKNKEITDSINYAKRIQQSILTSDAYFKKYTSDSFILFKPKDIVSGDFYWALEHEGKFLVMTADCTGHGVPGAMMSMMGINFLNEIVNERKTESPAAVLNQLRKDIVKALNPEGSLTETKDGMDCSLCRFDFVTGQLTYSNANNHFYVIRNGALIVSNTNKMPVGAGHSDMELFKEWTLDLQKNDVVLTLTDGYADQFGGPKGKKFKYRQLEEVLLAHAHLPMHDMKQKLNEVIENWKGALEQIDDICMIGIRI
jgi:serine phosphatase RsbU (regulator of sigma subunit)